MSQANAKRNRLISFSRRNSTILIVFWHLMKAKVKKSDVEVPFDPVLFAAAVPARRPTPKDLVDVEEHKHDAIEDEEFGSREDVLQVRPSGIRRPFQ
jgi:hypothetical protein